MTRRSAPCDTGHATRWSRRELLRGALAMGGAAVAAPLTTAGSMRRAGAAGPPDRDGGAVVVVTLLGGNDALNTVVPRTGAARATYESRRGALAIPASQLVGGDADVDGSGFGFHGSLPMLAARYDAGEVAVIEGVGSTGDLSHFIAQDTMMSGTGAPSATGWLGRAADDAPDRHDGWHNVAIGSTVPLHLRGQEVRVAALPSVGGIWGAERTKYWEADAIACVRAFADDVGPGAAGELARSQAMALDLAEGFGPILSPTPTGSPLSRDLQLAARVLDADRGTRAVAVELQGWDTHARQAATHAGLLRQLDEGLAAFFATLDASRHRDVVVLVVSEFGRRIAPNGSSGTDHGHGGTAFLIGDAVAGGRVGTPPDLDHPDEDGNVAVTTELRDVYRTILDEWLGGAGDAVGSGPTLPLFDRRSAVAAR